MIVKIQFNEALVFDFSVANMNIEHFISDISESGGACDDDNDSNTNDSVTVMDVNISVSSGNLNVPHINLPTAKTINRTKVLSLYSLQSESTIAK